MAYFNLQKSLALCLFVVFFIQTSFPQISISFGYKSFFPKGWSDNSISYGAGTLYPFFGWEAAVGYRIKRAERYRIEFTPSFSYSQFDENAGIIWVGVNTDFYTLNHKQFALQFNVASYVFDFFGDITDPRHTSSVGFLRSHTFFEIAPIFVHYRNKIIIDRSNSNHELLGTGYTIGGNFGLGLDLPLSNSHVLTLLTRFHYFPDYDRNGSPRSIKSDLRQVFIGCRWRVLFNEY
jgi:hypothetical protein